jgi:hypothetical protein
MSSSGLAALAAPLALGRPAAFAPGGPPPGVPCPDGVLFALATGDGRESIGARVGSGAASSTAVGGGELAGRRGAGALTAEARGGGVVTGLT